VRRREDLGELVREIVDGRHRRLLDLTAALFAAAILVSWARRGRMLQAEQKKYPPNYACNSAQSVSTQSVCWWV